MAGADSDFTDYFVARAPALRRLAYALCADWHTADDLVQVSFVKLYRHWPTAARGTVDAYVRRILVNTYLSHRRDRRRELVVAEVPETEATTVDTDRREDLTRALQSLPAQQRAVVVLRHLEDLSIADVAELLGVAEGTVKSQNSRAVDALRRALGTPALTKE